MSSNKNENTSLQVEADEKHLLLDHNYDGIQELNHPLPSWWNFIFYAGIIFGVCYWVYYSFLGGPTLRDELKVEMAQVKVLQDEYKALTAAYNPEKFNELNKPENMQKAIAIFAENCVQCHKEGGLGDVGPNLTDNYWKVSKGTPESNYQVVYYGSEEAGMPAWGEVLSSEDIYLALAYVNSLKNTFAKGGKEPQGVKIDD
ncbi:MAG: c-type cytochrome [Bacteriovoracaceae bacterium]|nr:c-type cytochrome [Bacteriovoracaceae bacterium]